MRDSRATLPEVLKWLLEQIHKVIAAERILLSAKVARHGHGARYRGEVSSTTAEGLAAHRAPRKAAQRATKEVRS